MLSMEDEAIAELEEQCLRLKAHNRQLHAALTAIQEKVPFPDISYQWALGYKSNKGLLSI